MSSFSSLSKANSTDFTESSMVSLFGTLITASFLPFSLRMAGNGGGSANGDPKDEDCIHDDSKKKAEYLAYLCAAASVDSSGFTVGTVLEISEPKGFAGVIDHMCWKEWMDMLKEDGVKGIIEDHELSFQDIVSCKSAKVWLRKGAKGAKDKIFVRARE